MEPEKQDPVHTEAVNEEPVQDNKETVAEVTAETSEHKAAENVTNTSPEKKPDEPIIKEVQPEEPEIIKTPEDDGFNKFVVVSVIIIIILTIILFFLMRS